MSGHGPRCPDLSRLLPFAQAAPSVTLGSKPTFAAMPAAVDHWHISDPHTRRTHVTSPLHCRPSARRIMAISILLDIGSFFLCETFFHGIIERSATPRRSRGIGGRVSTYPRGRGCSFRAPRARLLHPADGRLQLVGGAVCRALSSWRRRAGPAGLRRRSALPGLRCPLVAARRARLGLGMARGAPRRRRRLWPPPRVCERHRGSAPPPRRGRET